MPIIKSAKKRVRVAKKATVRNVKTRRSLKAAVKSFQTAVSGGKKTAASAHDKVQSNLDKAGKKNIMHKNKVARKKRQLAAKLKTAGVKNTVGTKKAAAKKPAVKKPAVKKAPAKKLGTKKKTTKK